MRSLHLVTDPMASRSALAAAVAAAVAGGADWIQVREKGAAAADLLATCESLGQALGGKGRLLVNDRLDVALVAGAGGVHTGRRGLPPKLARAVAPGLLIGVSVHTVQEAVQSVEAGADYVTFGSVFPTDSHPGQAPQGLDLLAAVVAAVPVPVLAIGGITPENVGAVGATGCAGVAVIRAILKAADPRAAAAALRQALDQASGQPRVAFPAPGGIRGEEA